MGENTGLTIRYVECMIAGESDFPLFQPEDRRSGGRYQETSSGSVRRIFSQLLYI